jgi:hypothetical protein
MVLNIDQEQDWHLAIATKKDRIRIDTKKLLPDLAKSGSRSIQGLA